MEKLRLLKILSATLIIATANLCLERTSGGFNIIGLTVKTISLVGLFVYFYAYVLNADERTIIKNWQSGT